MKKVFAFDTFSQPLHVEITCTSITHRILPTFEPAVIDKKTYHQYTRPYQMQTWDSKGMVHLGSVVVVTPSLPPRRLPPCARSLLLVHVVAVIMGMSIPRKHRCGAVLSSINIIVILYNMDEL